VIPSSRRPRREIRRAWTMTRTRRTTTAIPSATTATPT